MVLEMRLSHTVNGCGKLAQKEYKQRYDSVGRCVHWQFCEKLGFNGVMFWYEYEAESVFENENFKILWDFTIHCNHMIEARRPDIMVIDKVKKKTIIIDVAIPGDTRVCDKEWEKIEKYSLLKNEIVRLWQMEKVIVIPIVVGALRTINSNVWEADMCMKVSWKTEKNSIMGPMRRLHGGCLAGEIFELLAL